MPKIDRITRKDDLRTFFVKKLPPQLHYWSGHNDEICEYVKPKGWWQKTEYVEVAKISGSRGVEIDADSPWLDTIVKLVEDYEQYADDGRQVDITIITNLPA